MTGLLEKLEQVLEELENQTPEEIVSEALSLSVKVNLRECQIEDFEIILTLGGPTIWLTKDGLYGSWGGEEYQLRVNDELINKIFDYVEELAIKNGCVTPRK